MIGILFLATVALWIIGSVLLAGALGRLVTNQRWRPLVSFVALFVFLSAPFVDEVIGKRQFQTLCEVNGIDSADLSKARGKQVRVRYRGHRLLEGTILPIEESIVQFVDVQTDEVLIEHKNYHSPGGWVMRHTWLSLGANHPMLFDGNGCGLRVQDILFKHAGIVIVN